MKYIFNNTLLIFNNLSRKYLFDNKSSCIIRFMKCSTVASINQNKHLQLTVESLRIPLISNAKVIAIHKESPTVSGFTLEVKDRNFSFFAGQWVDLFIPGMDTVGGFSICSPPSKLLRDSVLNLGIKYSKWPPAHWMCSECVLDTDVSIRVGGDFYFAPHIDDKPIDLLLIAGGVGINPLASIFLHNADLFERFVDGNTYRPGKVELLYSSRTSEELLYKKLLDDVAVQYPEMSVNYFVTGNEPSLNSDIFNGCIARHSLEKAFCKLNGKSLRCYICGPPPMISSIEYILQECGLQSSQIYYEKWW